MPYVETQIGLLVRAKPAEARARVLAAYEEHEGRGEQTAAALGVTLRTLDRWTEALGIGDRVEEIRRRRRERASEGAKKAAKRARKTA